MKTFFIGPIWGITVNFAQTKLSLNRIKLSQLFVQVLLFQDTKFFYYFNLFFTRHRSRLPKSETFFFFFLNSLFPTVNNNWKNFICSSFEQFCSWFETFLPKRLHFLCNFTCNHNNSSHRFIETFTAWKVCKYRVFSGPYFPVFGLNTEIYSVYTPFQISLILFL